MLIPDQPGTGLWGYLETMDLMNDLSNDLAFTFLVERKNEGDLTSRDVKELIDRIKHALSPVDTAEQKRAVNDRALPSRSEH